MLSIRKKEYDFLSGEVNTWLDQEIISSEQAENIISLYNVKKRNLPMILLTAGGVLLFFGFVSFIAAHWHELNKLFRVCIISSAYVISLISYFFMRKSSQDVNETGFWRKETGRILLLLSTIIFGAGIFLITRMYDIKLTFSEVLGWWLIEIISAALITRDNWQVYFAQAISLIWLSEIGAINFFALNFIMSARLPVLEFFSPVSAFALILALWFVWNFTHERLAFIMNMFLTLLLLASRMSLCLGGTWTLIILMYSGALMSFMSKFPDAEILGLLMLGLCGLLLTWPEFWHGDFFASHKNFLAVMNAFILALLMLINIYRAHFSLGITFCAMLISRYFFDHLFGYMPKAFTFTLTGIICLIAGLYFGRRK